MFHSITNVEFTTSAPFFANAMLCDVAFRGVKIKLLGEVIKPTKNKNG